MELSTERAQALVADAIEAAGFDACRPGKQVGRYEILRELGSGAMGDVYEAFDSELQRRVAIKRIRAVTLSRQARARFLREARALARLSHPNIIAAFEVGWHDRELFLVMEYVEGTTLRTWMERERTVEEVVDVVLGAARGLQAAHERGLVHRDLKPENVIVGDDGRARVLDFGLVHSTAPGSPPGIAEATLDMSSRVTAAGRAVGTPAYMAPEQAGGAIVGPAADQYALCVVLCEALCGERPGIGDSPAPWLRSHRVPRSLVRVILRGLAPRAKDRFGSVAELIDALQPQRRKTRARLWVGAGAAGILVAASAWFARPPPCDPAAKLAGVWDDDARRTVQASFRAALGERSGDWFDRSRSSLDRYAADWTGAYGTVCRTRNDTTPQVFDAKMACLHATRERLSSFVGLLGRHDPEIATRAAEGIGQLPDPARCTDASRTGPSPGDPVALARAHALVDVGRPRAALEEIESVHAVTKGEASTATLAEAKLLRARSLQAAQQHAAAVGVYADAYWAASAARRDELAAEAAARCAALLSEQGARRDEGRAWLRHAESSLREDHDPDVVAIVHQARAAVASSGDRMADAERHLAAAITVLTDAYGGDDPRIAAPLIALAKSARLASEFEAADDRLDRALAIYVRAYGPSHPAVADVRFGLGRVASSREDVANAREHFDAAARLYRDAFGPDHPRVGRVHSELAALAFLRGDLEDAFDLAKRGVRIVERGSPADDVRLADPLRILGVIATERGDFKEAARALLRAESMCLEAYGPDHSRVAVVLLALSQVYRRQEDNPSAIATLRRVLAINERVHGPASLQAAFALGNLGTSLQSHGRSEEGIGALLRARGLASAIHGVDHPIVAQFESNLGIAYFEEGTLDAAEAHLRRALEINAASVGAEHPNLAYHLDGLGRVALARGQANHAVECFERAVELRRRAGVSSELLAYSQAGLDEALRAAGRRRVAF